MSGQTDVANLGTLADAVDRGTDRLREHLERFEGGVDENTGEITIGIRTLYEEAIAKEIDEIALAAEREGKRPPAEDIRLARATRIVKEHNAELYRDYHALKGSIETGQRWLSGKRASLSALQTLNKTGTAFAGVAG